jgi:hypothetical protein
VSQFIVRVTLTLTLGNQTGDVWSGQATVSITDILDRSHNVVHWGPHGWAHVRRSRIHRTAVSAHCRALRIAAVMG